MENFTNKTIDTKQLPKFEEVDFTALHPKYGRVISINLVIVVGILIAAPFVFSILKPELFSGRVWFILGVLILILAILIIVFSIIGFQKKGFAFREHDVLFRYGVIATNTIVIRYYLIKCVS